MEKFILCEKTGLFIADTATDQEQLHLTPTEVVQRYKDRLAKYWEDYVTENFVLCEKTGLFIADTATANENLNLSPPVETEQGYLKDGHARHGENYGTDKVDSIRFRI